MYLFRQTFFLFLFRPISAPPPPPRAPPAPYSQRLSVGCTTNMHPHRVSWRRWRWCVLLRSKKVAAKVNNR